MFDPSTDSHGQVKGIRDMTISACPTRANAQAFAGVTNPHMPSWNQSESGTVPDWIAQLSNEDETGCCDSWEASRQDMGFRNRSSALLDLDNMFKTIFTGLEELGVMDNTYIMSVKDWALLGVVTY